MQPIKKTLRPGLLALGLALTFGAPGIALAQDGDNYTVGDGNAAPTRNTPDDTVLPDENSSGTNSASQQAQGPVRLARFAYIEGNVTWREDESAAWADASVNLPVRQGAQIWVAEQGRAEIQLDDGSLLRLGSGALVTLQTLYSDSEGEFTEIKLNQGLASLRVRHNRSVYQVDTPYVSVKTSGPSKVRVGAGAAVEVAVQEGDASVEGSQGRADLHRGDYLYLDNPDAAFAIRRLPRADSWERWNEERDASLEEAADRPSSQYLPPNIALVAPDLDAYGTWRDDPDYGHVWCPRVVEADWRPYSAGRWTWVQPFGWTWVSSEAWGWAPYHYGTWCHRNYGWAWCPGPVTQYWSPAVVHFSEYNGGIAWCPLAPREVRYPASLSIGFRGGNWAAFFSIGQAAVYYPTGNRYCEARPWNSNYLNHITRINNTTNINVTNIYNDNRYVVNHNVARNLPFSPINAQSANGASSASLAAFSGRGAYRALPRSEASVFTEGRTITAPQIGQRPVAGPVTARPTALSTSSTRTLAPGGAPSAIVANRRVFRAPLPQSVQRGVGNTPQTGRLPQTNTNGGYTRSAPAPNRASDGGYTRTPGGVRGGYTGSAGGADGSADAARNPYRTTPNAGTGERYSRRDNAATGGGATASASGRNWQTGNAPRSNGASGAANSSGADRARAARQSLGIGRGYGGPNGTYRQDPAQSGTRQPQSSARPGVSRPNDSPNAGRSETSRNGDISRTPRRDTYSPRPQEPTRSAPTARPNTPPTRSEAPVRRESPTPRSEPRSEPRQERRSEPAHSEPSHHDSGGSGESKGSGSSDSTQSGRHR